MKTHFYVEQRVQKDENLFFMESSINLEDNVWDMLDVDEIDLSILELHEK